MPRVRLSEEEKGRWSIMSCIDATMYPRSSGFESIKKLEEKLPRPWKTIEHRVVSIANAVFLLLKENTNDGHSSSSQPSRVRDPHLLISLMTSRFQNFRKALEITLYSAETISLAFSVMELSMLILIASGRENKVLRIKDATYSFTNQLKKDFLGHDEEAWWNILVS